jgi:hypothetical protein
MTGKITWRLAVGSPALIGDGGVAAVSTSLAAPRKGTEKLLHLRAPRGLWLHQTNEDIKALLLSSTARVGVVGIVGVGWLPAS